MEKLLYSNLTSGSRYCFVGLSAGNELRGFMHEHNFAEIFIVLRGIISHRLNGHVHTLKYGNAALIFPETRHSVSGIGIDGDIYYLNVAFPAETLAEFDRRYPGGLFRYPGYTEHQVRHFRLASEDVRLLSGIVRDITGSFPENRLAFERFLINFAAVTDKCGAPDNPMPDWLAYAVNKIQSEEKADLKTFQRLCGRDPSHIGRVMRSVLGTSPEKWLLGIRLERAAELLLRTRKTIDNVALDCAFDNYSYFHRCFKARFHRTPAQYRRLFSASAN